MAGRSIFVAGCHRAVVRPLSLDGPSVLPSLRRRIDCNCDGASYRKRTGPRARASVAWATVQLCFLLHFARQIGKAGQTARVQHRNACSSLLDLDESPAFEEAEVPDTLGATHAKEPG